MKFLFFIVGLLSIVRGDDFLATKYQFITDIVERHLKLPTEPDLETYREQLADKLFNELVKRYPEQTFFVDIYAPVMGFENHATRSFDFVDRYHK
jgi:hypothetical protein